MIKRIVKKIIPKKGLLFYHWFLAKLAAFVYGQASQKMVVIGVTGTNGKSTTVNFIAQYLQCQGQKTGLLSTNVFKIGEKEWLNDQKMTMLGRFQTQKMLKQMFRAGCKYAVIETSSQGIEQFRHIGINYDLVIFTNLTPEHIEAHGSFENYRAAKEKLFKHLSNLPKKTIQGKTIAKIIVSNADDKETNRLKNIKIDKFVTYSLKNNSDYQAKDIDLQDKLSFSVDGRSVKTVLLGKFNIYNILAALTAVTELGFELDKLIQCQIKPVPGRQEWIEQGQNFKVLIDYAPEPEGLGQLYQALDKLNYNRLIHVLGSCGGGRDKARQPIMGKLAGEKADIVIITNEDPYDDDPMEIINNVAKGAFEAGKDKNKNLFKIENRAKAIEKAVNLAQENDLVLVTGKGCEQYMCVAKGKKIPWDDRQIVSDAIKNI